MNFHKIFHYGQKANRNGNKLIVKLCKFIMRVYYNCDIDFSAQIDESVWLCHNGFGIVINPKVVVGGGDDDTAFCDTWRNTI